LFAAHAPDYRADGLSQGNCTVQFGILDGPIFAPLDASPTFLVLGHEDIEGGLWTSLQLAPPPPHSFVIGHPSDFSA
jgi:hypothetical protein